MPEENVALLRDAGFPAQAQRDVWGANLDALVCGSYAPSGTLALAKGGWRVSGRWSFDSGCDVAQWAVCGALLRPEGEPPQAVFLLILASDYQIDATWAIAGLAGTGSKTLALTDVFLPAHRVLAFKDICAGTMYGQMALGLEPRGQY